MPAETPALTATVKYNPHLWGPAELRAIFVVRTRELADLLRLLRGTAQGAMPQHLLITGARGMGKTTLLRRLALAVEDDPELAARWVPVTFPEEQYTVSTLAELWRNVLDALADTREHQGAPAAELDQLDREIARIGDLPAAERETAALDSLDAWVRTNERRLLLLIDSTDLLLANLAATAEPGAPKAGQGTPIDGGATPLWRLRKTLSHNPSIFWLGASYQSLESNHAYQDAFWDFFQLVELRALTVAEMREAMLALARTFGAGRGLTGEAAVQEMTRNLDTRPERLKALRAITGGNPRTTVMLYELFAAGGADDVHSDLRRLLDTMTPLYKARMETLSDQARKLLAHLMEHWAPISARGLGEVSGIATNTVSGQLTRLEAEGLVEKARLSGTKRTGYQAAERLFNVWYLMRYASRRLRQRLTWLVEFMRLWFSGEELVELARSRADEHLKGRLCGTDQLEYSRALGLALPDGEVARYRLDLAVYGAARQSADCIRSILSDLFELDGEDREYTTAEDYLKRLEALDASLARLPNMFGDTRQQRIEVVKGSLSFSLVQKEVIAQAAVCFDEAADQKFIAALEHKWRRSNEMRSRSLCLADKEVIAHSGTTLDQEPVREFQAALDNIRREWTAGGRVSLSFTEKSAIAQAVARSTGAGYCTLLAAQRKSIRVWTDGFGADAVRIVQRAVLEGGFFPDCPDAKLAYSQIMACFGEDANAFRLVLFLFGRHHGGEWLERALQHATKLDAKNAQPWSDLGHLLALQPKRLTEAEAAYRRAIELNPNDVGLWNNLGELLAARLDRPVEAEAAYRRAMELAPSDAYPIANLARLLAKFGRKGEADVAYRQAAALAAAADAPPSASDTSPVIQSIGHANLLLQSHLWLTNRDLARQALDRLAGAAAGGNRDAFARLKEQSHECHRIGLGPALRDLMTEGTWADFLQPFALALGAAATADPADALAGAPPELRTLAEEVLADLRPSPSTAPAEPR